MEIRRKKQGKKREIGVWFLGFWLPWKEELQQEMNVQKMGMTARVWE